MSNSGRFRILAQKPTDTWTEVLILIVDSLRTIHNGEDPKLRSTLGFTLDALRLSASLRGLIHFITSNTLRSGTGVTSRKLAESITFVENAGIHKAY